MTEGKDRKKILVLGGVACGPKAAARARRRDLEAQITILERGDYVSYGGCGLPFFVAGAVPTPEGLMSTTSGHVRDAQYFKRIKDIDVFTGVEAVEIDRNAKKVKAVRLATGENLEFPYDKLVLAVGAEPVMPPIPGIDLQNVFPLRKLEQGKAILDTINQGMEIENAVIIGGGRVGLEIADAFNAQGLEVTVVEMCPNVLGTLLDPEIAFQVETTIRQEKANVFTGEKVLRLAGDEQGQVKKVVTDKRELDAEIVLFSVGVRPNVKLAVNAGLELGPLGTVQIDEYCRTSDPDIYAGGDCVACTHLVTGKPVYAPMGSTANKHGRIIGNNITGSSESFPGVLGTSLMKVYGANVGITGLSETQAREVGYDVVCSWAPSTDKSHFLPGGNKILVKLIADRQTRKLLGAQIIGPGNMDKPIDTLATALFYGATIDQVANIDIGYAPPFASAIAPTAHAANIIRNKIDGLGGTIDIFSFNKLLDSDKEFVILDVRKPKEIENLPFHDRRVKIIEMGEVLERIGELNKNDEVYILCMIGSRSYEVDLLLKSFGFKKTAYLEGGVSMLHSTGLIGDRKHPK